MTFWSLRGFSSRIVFRHHLCYYSSPAWWGYLSKSDLHCLKGLICRAKRLSAVTSYRSMGPPSRAWPYKWTGPSSKLSSGIQIMSCAIYVMNGLSYPTPRPHPFVLPTRDDKNFPDDYIMTSTNTFSSLTLVHNSANYITTTINQ